MCNYNANRGAECDPVLTTGEQGEFLIRLPESEALLKIANKTKNVKRNLWVLMRKNNRPSGRFLLYWVYFLI